MSAGTDGRWGLWAAVEQAVRASFPDRGDGLLDALERRIEPGPWSADRGKDPGAARGWSRDTLLAEIARALRAAEPERADARLDAIERWMQDSARRSLAACLGLRDLGSCAERAVVDWASEALEAGLDTPSLRVLAGLGPMESSYELEDWLGRARRELGIERSETGELRAAAMSTARDVVQGRIEVAEAARRLYDIAVSLPPGDGDLVLWRRMRWEFDLDWTDRSFDEYRREVVEAARAMLGAAPGPGGT